MKNLLGFLFLVSACCDLFAGDKLEAGWLNPPRDARLHAYWWWLNGNVTREAITRDLEEMKAKGFGGALLCDADGSSQDGNDRVPHGPTFFSPAWRELYKHTLREADRLGLEISLNIQSGWNLGGPMVTQDDAPKKLTWSETEVLGPTNLSIHLEKPKARDGYYRDLYLLAYKGNPHLPSHRKPLENLEQKTLRRPLEPFSAPVSTPLFEEFPSAPNEQDATTADVLEISSNLSQNGTLRWTVPPGNWHLIRFGCTISDHCRVSTCSEGWDGYAIDPFDAGAFDRYWNTVVEPLIRDAGPLAGKSLRYLHTDSWEVEVSNWTPTLRSEFKKRRGYDLLPWLPVIAGRIINTREQSDRFLADFRRTIGDLAIDHHYKLFKDRAHKHGLQIHPESGGPHAVPIDAQQCLGYDDAPMSEFWAWSWRHRIGDENRFFVKQPASASHTYGHKLVLAEGFTTLGPNWQETLWDNLKPAFDHACTEGLNLLVWHAFVCSPREMGLPGQQYFAGTHLNPNVTWWQKSQPFFSYINRCQWMLQQGLPVADVAYYYGDHVPNFAQLRKSDPAKVGAGYDYDVLAEETLVKRLIFANGKLVLPNGITYRALVLPDRSIISLPALKRIEKFARAGATIIGPQPSAASGLSNYPRSDSEVHRLAAELWGRGLVLTNRNAREVLLENGIEPDFEFHPARVAAPEMDYVHRDDSGSDIYFVANRSSNAVCGVGKFRIAGKAPELWDPVTGKHHYARAYKVSGGRTAVPIDFNPCGSIFVVFRTAAELHPPVADQNSPTYKPVMEVNGPWAVDFDKIMGGPGTVTFSNLVSWTARPESGIKYYSGTATYKTSFAFPEGLSAAASFSVDLGDLREIADVKLNGRPCGITWSPPFRVDVTGAIHAGKNQLEVEVVNFWPNRLIGDAALPPESRITRTNIRKLTPETPLMPSGLFGPLRLLLKQ